MTQDKINELNNRQRSNQFHPLTCCSDANSPSCKRRSSSDARWEKSREYLKLDIDLLREMVKKSAYSYPIDGFEGWQLANILASNEIPYSDENEGVLIATESGWVCPCGEYTQKITF